MILVEFFGSEPMIGFRVSGHAGAGVEGEDIVCAAVSSAAYMTANTVTDILGITPELDIRDGDMLLRCRTVSDADRCGDLFSGFLLHMVALSEQYEDYIHVTHSEV